MGSFSTIVQKDVLHAHENGMQVHYIPFKKGKFDNMVGGAVGEGVKTMCGLNLDDAGEVIAPLEPSEVIELCDYIVQMAPDQRRGTRMLEVHLASCQTGGFDENNWRKCGLCFATLPFYLRALAGKVRTHSAHARLVTSACTHARLNLRGSGPRVISMTSHAHAQVYVHVCVITALGVDGTDNMRGRAHAQEIKDLLCIPDHILWMDKTKPGWGLIHGKHPCLEGLSITISGPAVTNGSTATPLMHQLKDLLGFLSHFDVSNDSRWGWDKTGNLSLTFMYRGAYHRFSCIGYTRYQVGCYWDHTSAGTATLKSEKNSGRSKGARRCTTLAKTSSRVSSGAQSAKSGSQRARRRAHTELKSANGGGTHSQDARRKRKRSPQTWVLPKNLVSTDVYGKLVNDVAAVTCLWGVRPSCAGALTCQPDVRTIVRKDARALRALEWVQFAETQGLPFDQASRPQVVAFARSAIIALAWL
jgi:hypothetical protein